MSENLEINDVTAEAKSDDAVLDETTENKDVVEADSESSKKSEDVSVNADDNNSIDERDFYEGFLQFLSDYVQKRDEAMNEFNSKRDYLMSNLAKYDTEDYFQNDDFKNLYTEAFNSLGTKLDTEKFINLVDKYVNSRLDAHSKKIAIGDENTSLTDGLSFEKGGHKNVERNFRLQDIPADQLEKYIEKYI